MFKPFPDVVLSQECGNGPDANYSINWEEIARWAIENGELDNVGGDQPLPQATNNGQPIDWCGIADSFMRDEGDEISAPVRAHDRSIHSSVLRYPSESVSRLVAEGFEDFPLPIQHRERNSTSDPDCPRRRPAQRDYSSLCNSELNRSMRDSDFNNTSCYDTTPQSSMPEFSCMENLHDSSDEYQSDIMSYIDGRAGRNRPHSIAEGYHFPGRAYGTVDNDDCRMFVSTPKKKQRTTRAETFELANGSKMFNVTFEECRDFGRRLRHISDVRDSDGCQLMHIDREINEEENGASHRVDVARRWLDFDDNNCG